MRIGKSVRRADPESTVVPFGTVDSVGNHTPEKTR